MIFIAGADFASGAGFVGARFVGAGFAGAGAAFLATGRRTGAAFIFARTGGLDFRAALTGLTAFLTTFAFAGLAAFFLGM